MMYDRLTSERLIAEYADQMATIARRIGAAIRNLDQSLPGYPSSTPGANPASAGGAPLESGSTTERLALSDTVDPALAARRRVDEALRAFHAHVPMLYSLSAKWGYSPSKPPAREEDQDHDWCLSCLRIERCEPRYAGVSCRWCYDFVMLHPEFHMPPRDLLRAHHEGRRITQAMIEQAHPVRRGKK